MRIALVGPTHPYKGGIAHHTTELAHRLASAGHAVALISWSAQYPALLYPGIQRATDDKPETAPFPSTSFPLSWWNPLGWVRVGQQLRAYDRIVLVVVTSFQAPAYLTMLAALGSEPPRSVLALCHNVLPHERRFFDLPLTKAVLSRVDRVLVHTPEQATLAQGITTAPVSVAELPPHLPARPDGRLSAERGPLRRRLAFFGLVRDYKGVDVLLRAVAAVPEIGLSVAGEIWGGAAPYERLIEQLGIAHRVTLLSGYLPSQQVPALLAEADALVLPYRSGTATQNVHLAHAHGLPVIATRVGSMATQVRDGIDGLLCNPDDVDDLTKAIQRFYAPGMAQRLRENLPRSTGDESWGPYLDAVVSAGSPR